MAYQCLSKTSETSYGWQKADITTKFNPNGFHSLLRMSKKVLTRFLRPLDGRRAWTSSMDVVDVEEGATVDVIGDVHGKSLLQLWASPHPS